jgi:hypothetical protein
LENEDWNDSVSSVQATPSAGQPKRDWFRSGNIYWVYDPDQDEIKTDCRGRSRTIKRYMGHNKGKNYHLVQTKPTGRGTFSIDTDQ